MQLSALSTDTCGLQPCDFEDVDLQTWIGAVQGLDEVSLPTCLAEFDCRNNRLANLGLEQDDFLGAVATAAENHGAERIGVFIGTSTSGLHSTEHAYRARDAQSGALPSSFRYRQTHNGFSVTDFTRRRLELRGPAQSVLTACSSSAKVFAAAYRCMRAGLCDAAVVGGVDSLCLTTLYGFNSLELVSTRPCRPWDGERDGLSIGEAAGFALLEWACPGDRGIGLLGYGESADAYHMSSPDPHGTGAALAMRAALESAGLRPEDIDYISLHGTATPTNDAAEDKAVTTVFGERVACSSTKGATGHTLGAAGITEVVLCGLAIEHGWIPGTLNTELQDPDLNAGVVLRSHEASLRRAMSNSFGFGGNNCSLVVGRLPV